MLLKKERARREMTEFEEEEEETMAPTLTPLSSNTPPLPSPSTTTTKTASGKKEQPKPRLVIKSMVLENFKSYAGAQHVGPFHKVSTSFLESSFVGRSSFWRFSLSLDVFLEKRAFRFLFEKRREKCNRTNFVFFVPLIASLKISSIFSSTHDNTHNFKTTTVVLICSRSKWVWEIERHRCDDVCFW